MKLDLDGLEREAIGERRPIVVRHELAALVRIARAAIAWRDNAPQSGTLNALLDALREAGL